MNRVLLCALTVVMSGCTRQPTPVVQVPAATPMPTTTATATPYVAPTIAMPTPTPDAEKEARKAVVLRELARLNAASPEADVETAWADKDTRFMVVRGAGWHVPGVPKERVLELINRYDGNPIEGTTDFIEFPEDPEQTQLAKLAFRYATRYNQLLLRKLDEQSGVNGN